MRATTETDEDGEAVGGQPYFRILGSLDVRSGGRPVRVSGELRQRTLAMLLLDAGRVVPVSRLVEAGWDGEPPESAAHQIRKAVAELRHRIPRGPDLIVTDGPGYRTTVAGDQLDLLRYRALLRDADRAQEDGAHEEAAARLRAALELWRGPVLAGAGGRVISAVSTALEEQHLAAAEQLYALIIESGRAASILGELRALAAQHPLRENLRGQLMLALYHTGQQAAALDEFTRLRRQLADELGIDPSAQLTELHAFILQQDASLDARARTAPERTEPGRPPGGPVPAPAPAQAPVPAPVAVPPAAAPPDTTDPRATAPHTVPHAAPHTVPHALPYDVPDFSGRRAELEWIEQAAAQAPPGAPRVLAIDGMGGGGKTALAVRAAHLLAERYPDGRLFVDLRGFTPGQEMLSAFSAQGDLLAAAGIPSEEIPGVPAGRSALWQSYTRGRRLLLVLDNAATSEQVRALIPTSPGSLTLVTSRHRLTDLDGVEWLSLTMLPEEDSAAILRRILGAGRVAREPDAAGELLRLCGGLPLAVRIAAARLSNRPRWTIQHLVGRLQDHGRRLDELSSEGRGVASALTLSYQAMPDEQRTAFRLLGHHPGRYVDTGEAAALFGTGVLDAEDVLERLVDVRLLEAREPGVYAFHDLVRNFALRLAQGEDGPQDRAAVRRLLDHYQSTAEQACDVLFPGRSRLDGSTGTAGGRGPDTGFGDKDAALRWLDRHRDSLLAAVGIAYAGGLLRHAARLPRELGFHSSIRSYDTEANTALETGVRASRALKDPGLLRLNLTNLAMGHWRLGSLRQAVATLEDALELSWTMNDRRSAAECKARLGQALGSLGDLDRALLLSREAHATARETGFVRLAGSSLSTLSQVLVRLGRYAEAAEAAGEALGVFASIGEVQLSVDALRFRSQALEGLGRFDEAMAHLDEAAERCAQLRMPSIVPLVLAHRADVLVSAGRTGPARETALHALAESLHSTDDVHRAAVHLSAGRAHRAAGDVTAARHQYKLAEDIAARMELRYEHARALDGLARTTEALGDPDAAGRHRAEAAALRAAMGVPGHGGETGTGGTTGGAGDEDGGGTVRDLSS